jgi:uncharacterized protein involved in exopolysaccharide biosynthesis
MKFDMTTLKATLLATVVIFLTVGVQGQTMPEADVSGSVRSSAAYAEVMLRRTSLQADLEALLLDYKEEFPRVRSLRREIEILDESVEMLMKLPLSSNGKMTSAVGKLIVRRAELETESSEKSARYGDTHPEVRRAKKRVEVFERSIRELLD